MKRLLFISFVFLSIVAYSQRTQHEVVTGVQSGDGELKTLITNINSDNTNEDAIFNISDSTISDLNYIDFNTSDGWIQQEGRAAWDADDKTLRLGTEVTGTVIQVGQEVVIRATNKTGSQIDDGKVVYVDGAQGNRPTIRLADNDSVTAILTLGVATNDIANNMTGYVTMLGLVRDYDTRSFSAGDILWLGDSEGNITNVRPDAPDFAISIGVAVNSTEEGIIAVRPVVVQRLSWLSDVNARDNQTTNDMLVWDDSMWIARDSIATNAITYTNTYWDDLQVPLTNTRINPANSEPDFEDAGDGTFAWGFDSDSDSTYALHFIAQTKHKRKDSTDLCAHLHWQPDGTNTGNVVWKLIYTAASIDSSFSVVDTFRIVDAGDGVALKHQLVDLGDIDGTDLHLSTVIKGHIARMGDAPDDTYTGTAYGLELDFHYQIDTPGSQEETTKY